MAKKKATHGKCIRKGYTSKRRKVCKKFAKK